MLARQKDRDTVRWREMVQSSFSRRSSPSYGIKNLWRNYNNSIWMENINTYEIYTSNYALEVNIINDFH